MTISPHPAVEADKQVGHHLCQGCQHEVDTRGGFQGDVPDDGKSDYRGAEYREILTEKKEDHTLGKQRWCLLLYGVLHIFST